MVIYRRSVTIPLDSKLCFDVWLESGTLQKATEELERRGIVNKPSGKQYTVNAVRNQAYLYMLNNPEKTYEIFNSKEPTSKDYFWEWLAYRAVGIFWSESRLRGWLKTNGFYDNQKFRYIYDKKYPKLHERGD